MKSPQSGFLVFGKIQLGFSWVANSRLKSSRDNVVGRFACGTPKKLAKSTKTVFSIGSWYITVSVNGERDVSSGHLRS